MATVNRKYTALRAMIRAQNLEMVHYASCVENAIRQRVYRKWDASAGEATNFLCVFVSIYI